MPDHPQVPGTDCYQISINSLASGCQDLAPFVRDHDHVLDPHTESAWDINTGLDGDHHARPQDLSLPGCHTRRFMNFQTYSVTRGVCEIFC